MKELSSIQRALRAPKDQRNNFGKFMYRKASDILQAVKPLLAEHDMSVLLDDEIVEKGGRLFLCASVSLLGSDGSEIRSTHGYAELDKHAGMSAEQAVGAASSYARKYALCGLFAIDDSTDDPDGIEPKHEPSRGRDSRATSVQAPATGAKAPTGRDVPAEVSLSQEEETALMDICADIDASASLEQIKANAALARGTRYERKANQHAIRVATERGWYTPAPQKQ
ncbi:MAG: ERF family protein [Paludibacteraceae bacterium]